MVIAIKLDDFQMCLRQLWQIPQIDSRLTNPTLSWKQNFHDKYLS